MYAIFENGGQQYKVTEGDVVDIALTKAEAGTEVTFDQVRLVEADGAVKVGQPLVDGAAVTATVMGEHKAPKVVGISFRRRQGSKVKTGHRQRYTRVKITGIQS